MTVPHSFTSTKHIEELAKRSVETTKQLEDRVYKLVSEVEPEVDGRYFISTADFHAYLNYAPLFNFPRHVLERFATEHKLLRDIRDNFLVRMGPTGFIREVHRSIRKCGTLHVGDIFFIKIEDSGKVSECICFSGEALSKAIDSRVSESIHKHSVGKKLKELLLNLREALSSREDYECYLILRPEELFDSSVRNQLDIMQVGVTFINNKKKLVKETVEAYYRAVQISSFATHSLLYEKERYYEKAVRQSVKGSIIKYGPLKDISDEVKMLTELSNDKKLNIPVVEKSEGGDRTGTGFSWYQMSRIMPQSLMDLITFTKGYDNYEIAALVRSSFMHLSDVYWGDKLKPMDEPILLSLLALSSFAAAAAGGARNHINSLSEGIKKGLPVKMIRGIEVYSSADLERFSGILDNIKATTPVSIDLNWNRVVNCRFELEDPIKSLFNLQESLANAFEGKTQKQFRRLFIPVEAEGKLHGDPHFGNLLVDASIPEDPLIFSIDPKKVELKDLPSYPDAINRMFKNTYNVLHAQLESTIDKDIAYDIGKILQTAACFYDVIYHKGFTLTSTRANSKRYKLRRNDKAESVKLSDVGGISSSQIIRLGAPIPPDTWDYHVTATKKVLDEYISLHHEKLLRFVPEELGFQESINIGLIRLWMFTVRHVFSAVKSLFPVKIESAMVMYIVAAVFTQKGVKTIMKRINRLVEADTQEELTRLFYWHEMRDDA